MRSSQTRTISQIGDCTCQHCGYDGEGTVIEDPEVQEATWYCPECGGEEDIDYNRDFDPDKWRD